MSNAVMRETFENWEKMVPGSKNNPSGISDMGYIKKTLDWLKEYRCPSGKTFFTEVYERVADYLELDEFVEKYTLTKRFSEARCNGKPDYYLTNALGKEMYEWLCEKSGLMDQMQFRLFLGVLLRDFVEYLTNNEPKFGVGGYLFTDEQYCALNINNSIRQAGLSPKHIMEFIIAPLFACLY